MLATWATDEDRKEASEALVKYDMLVESSRRHRFLNQFKETKGPLKWVMNLSFSVEHKDETISPAGPIMLQRAELLLKHGRTWESFPDADSGMKNVECWFSKL